MDLSCAGNGLAPMGLMFQFLSLLRAQGPQKWVFDELANIAQMRFKFAEEEDACEYALRLAADAPYYAPEHLLNGHYLYDQWDPKLVRLQLSPRRFAIVFGIGITVGMQKQPEGLLCAFFVYVMCCLPLCSVRSCCCRAKYCTQGCR